LYLQAVAVAPQEMAVLVVLVAQEGLKMVFPPLVEQVGKLVPAFKLGD
jgi:hypothetical protein